MRTASHSAQAPDSLHRAPATAKRLAISRATLWRWAKQGKITAVKLSDRVTGFRESEIQALISGGAQ
jgi:predicted DNA-binding transcriptional regulator AlpA